jgi:hypothetical protein
MRNSQRPPMNNQGAHSDSTSLSHNAMGHAPMDQHSQHILHSDAFTNWVIEKRIQEMIVFYNEEHALFAYLYELAHGSPSRAFLLQSNDLGTSLGTRGRFRAYGVH